MIPVPLLSSRTLPIFCQTDVSVPGAFTPTCNDQHLPGFINNLDRLKSAGVERVAVMTTNDRYVNSAWRDSVEACLKKDSGS